MELPKLKLSGVTKLSSYSSPALQSVFGPGGNGQAPGLRPLKCAGTEQKVARPRPPQRAAPYPSRLHSRAVLFFNRQICRKT